MLRDPDSKCRCEYSTLKTSDDGLGVVCGVCGESLTPLSDQVLGEVYDDEESTWTPALVIKLAVQGLYQFAQMGAWFYCAYDLWPQHPVAGVFCGLAGIGSFPVKINHGSKATDD